MSRYLVVSLLLLLGSPSWSWAAISCGSATENDAAGADPWNITYTAGGSGASTVVIGLLASAVSGAITVGADQSELSNQSVGGGNLTHASSQEAGASSVTMSWTLANSVGWTQIAASLKPDTSRRPSGIIYFP